MASSTDLIAGLGVHNTPVNVISIDEANMLPKAWVVFMLTEI